MGNERAVAKMGKWGWAVLWILAGTVFFVAVFHVWLGGELLWQRNLPSRLVALARWRDLDGIAGWVALLILALADQFDGGFGKRIVPWILGAGIAVRFVSVVPAVDSARPMWELAAAGLLAVGAGIVGLRQLWGITQAGQGGVTVEGLWRLVAVQWTLIWVAAEAFLRFKFRREGVGDGGVGQLLFVLPVMGAGPNILMAVGLGWWQAMRTAGGGALGRPRPRAWLVALMAVNLGIVGVLAGGVGPRWLAMVGVAPLIFGMLMYLLGFGRGAWSGGGRLVVVGLCIFVAGMLLFVGEVVAAGSGRGTLWEFTAAWRLLTGLATSVLWLWGMGGMAMRTWVVERARAPRAVRLSQGLVVIGFLAMAEFFALAGFGGREWLDGIFFGAVMVLLGVTVGMAVLLRAGRGVRG